MCRLNKDKIDNDLSYQITNLYHSFIQDNNNTSFCLPCTLMLTYWGWDTMPTTLQDSFSNQFSYIKTVEFLFTFHINLFSRAQLTISHYWLRQWLGADEHQAIISTNDCLVYCWIYESLSFDEFNMIKTSPSFHWLDKLYCLRTLKIIVAKALTNTIFISLIFCLFRHNELTFL